MMDAIKKEMLKAFDALLGKYTSIAIRYEYIPVYGNYLVSIDVSGLEKSELDNFSETLLSQIKELQTKFGDEAPLFSIGEEWFKLSHDAIYYGINPTEESLRIGKSVPRIARSRAADRIYHH